MNSFPKKMLRFCQIVGGLPVKYTSGTKGIKGLTFSATGFLWSLILVIMQEILSTIALYSYFMDRRNGQTLHPLARTNDISLSLHVVSLQVMAAVVFISSSRKYPRLVDVFDTLEHVYRNLHHKTSKVKVTVKVWGMCLVTAVSVTNAAKMVSFITGRIGLRLAITSAIRFNTTALSYCSQAALLVHFTHVTASIVKSFRAVNNAMEKEITRNITQQNDTSRSLPNDDVNHKTRTMLLTIKKLRTLMNTYWMLCDAVHQANVFYCDQLMAVMFSSFVHITISCYYVFLNSKTSYVFGMIYSGGWVLVHIYYLVLLVNSSTDVTSSADETGRMICKLIKKNLDPVLRKQMAGSVTTYLVIMIQFQTQPPST